jgi:hypothetical protein
VEDTGSGAGSGLLQEKSETRRTGRNTLCMIQIRRSGDILARVYPNGKKSAGKTRCAAEGFSGFMLFVGFIGRF